MLLGLILANAVTDNEQYAALFSYQRNMPSLLSRTVAILAFAWERSSGICFLNIYILNASASRF